MIVKSSKITAFKNSLANLTSQLDLFSMPPTFKVLNKDKFATKLGFTMTISITSLLVFYLFYLLSNMFDNVNPQVVQTTYASQSTTPMPLMKNNFTLVMALTDVNTSPLDGIGSAYNFILQNCLRETVLNQTTGKPQVKNQCNYYTVEPCSLNKHFPTTLQQDYFKDFALAQYYCINSDQWDAKPPILQGTPSSTAWWYLSVIVMPCVNSTTSQSCASQKEIDSTLNSGYYVVYSNDALIQMNSPEQPFQQTFSLSYGSMSNTNSLQIFDTRQVAITQSDQGRIFNNIITDQTMIQYWSQSQQTLYNGQYIVNHLISLIPKETLYNRTYQKAQQILGSIGGLFHIIFFITQILIDPVVSLMMNLQIANKIFWFFQSPTEENSDFEKGPIHRKKSAAIFRKHKIDNLKDKEEIQEFLKAKQQALELTTKQVLLLLCGCKTKAKQQIDYAVHKIANKLDVEFILTKLFEIDKLKQILLNKQQLQVFNYLQKPTIAAELFKDGQEDKLKELETNPHYNFILQEEKNDYIKLVEAYKAFQHIKQSNDKIDMMLTNHLDREIVELFLRISKGQTNLELGGFSSHNLSSPQANDDEPGLYSSDRGRVPLQNLNIVGDMDCAVIMIILCIQSLTNEHP